jgi:DNA-directed RNA polymerase specialized sigma24 family protein
MRDGGAVDRERALAALPVSYATALRLRDEGADHAAIARGVDVPLEAVENLLLIGDRKLAALLADGS